MDRCQRIYFVVVFLIKNSNLNNEYLMQKLEACVDCAQLIENVDGITRTFRLFCLKFLRFLRTFCMRRKNSWAWLPLFDVPKSWNDMLNFLEALHNS